jgi:hypothetical protein
VNVQTVKNASSKSPVVQEVKKDSQQLIKTPNYAPVVPKKIKYPSRYTCFEKTLIALNVLIFLGILFTIFIFCRILLVVHQKEISDYLSSLVSSI